VKFSFWFPLLAVEAGESAVRDIRELPEWSREGSSHEGKMQQWAEENETLYPHSGVSMTISLLVYQAVLTGEQSTP
jgi:hypothetical protein